MIRVKRHLRRRPEPTKVIDLALDRLYARKADKYLPRACHIQVTDQASQIVPVGGFGKGKCSAINLEPGDVRDEVAAATTIFHESIHAQDVEKNGSKSVDGEEGLKNEIEAHRETIRFLKSWLQDEADKNKRRRIMEELRDENKAIATLENE